MTKTNCLGKVLKKPKQFIVNLDGCGCLIKKDCNDYKLITKNNKIVIFQKYESGENELNKNRSYKTFSKKNFFNFYLNQKLGFKPTCSLNIKCKYYFFIIKYVEFINDSLIFHMTTCDLVNEKCPNKTQTIPTGKINFNFTIDDVQPIFDFGVLQTLSGNIEINYTLKSNQTLGQAILDSPITIFNETGVFFYQPNTLEQRFYISWEGENDYYYSNYVYKTCNNSSQFSVLLGASLIPNSIYNFIASGTQSLEIITFDNEYANANSICSNVLINNVEQTATEDAILTTNLTGGNNQFQEFRFQAIYYDDGNGGGYFWQIYSFPQYIYSDVAVTIKIRQSDVISNLNVVYAESTKCVQSSIYTPSYYNPNIFFTTEREQTYEKDFEILKSIYKISKATYQTYKKYRLYKKLLKEGKTQEEAEDESGLTEQELNDLNIASDEVENNFNGLQESARSVLQEEAEDLGDSSFEWDGEAIDILDTEIGADADIAETVIEIACECLEFLLL